MDNSALRPPYYYQEVIRRFSGTLAHIFTLPELLNSIVTTVAEIFGINKVSVLLKDETNLEYRVKASTGIKKDIAKEIKLEENEGIINWLYKREQILKREDLLVEKDLPERSRMIMELDLLGAHFCLPLFVHGDLIAVIPLGKKITGDKFTYEDINLLATMANYAAISIYNALLFQQVSFQSNYHQIIMDNIPTGIISTDNTGKITTMNKIGKNILGLEESELVGKNIQRTDSTIAEIMLKTLKEEKTYHRYEATLSEKNISVGISTSLLKNEKDRIVGGVMVFTDISKVKGLQKKIKKLEEEALWIKLAKGIAHEARNPLVSIRTFTQLFQDKYHDEEFRKDFYKIMNRDIGRLSELINKLEKYASPLSLHLQSYDLNSIIDEVLMNSKDKLAYQNIAVNKNYLPNLPNSVVDRNQMAEAFLHILNNSIKAMPEGGTFTVSTKVKNQGREEIVVEFSDTGEEISSKNMEKLFSPFLDTNFNGLELDLPITQKIIKAHNGRIEVDSVLEKGTSFKIFLPVN